MDESNPRGISAQLGPPGGGLPRLHLLFARYVGLPILWATTSWDGAQRLFEAEGGRILRLAARLDNEQLDRKVLVSGVFGIEDNSRLWSVSMAMEHLIIVGDKIADILVSLARHEAVPCSLAIKDVKPTGTLAASTLRAAFESFLKRYRSQALEATLDRSAPETFAHPWFGPMTPHQWQCLAAGHQRIHRKQIEAILRGL